MTEVDVAKQIMGRNFIGPAELCYCKDTQFKIPEFQPMVVYSQDSLKQKKDDYLLVLGVSEFKNGQPVTIRNMIKIFGKDPEIKEPCFYNQDWYDHETFIDVQMRDEWFMIRKNVYEDSRAVQPVELMKEYSFPNAVKCCYSFFVAWLGRGIKLWYHDFVWCSDADHNGDRIYVGKYHDVDGINKNGFSIHRYLALRPCYGCVD